ncbi:hypothetical protein PENSPDRAFT_368181 [Peniophora sp. CONT]|nr:hypothetical protein PENSPDRAFT_368181 [Peniophora sp. CONT]
MLGVTSLQLLEAVMSTNAHIESLTLHGTSIDTAGTQQSGTQVDLALLTYIKHLRVKGDEALAQLRTLLRVDALPALKIVDIDLNSNDDWRAVINLLRIRADALHPLDTLLPNGAIMYWDEAEQREESSLLKDVSEELHDRRKVIWKSSANLSSLS